MTIVAASGAPSRRKLHMDAEDHDVKVTLARDGQVKATVTGTYGDDPALIRQLLATVRPAA